MSKSKKSNVASAVVNPPVHYRQGDVLVERIESLPTGLTPVERDQGRVVLAYGEVTGHAHAIKNRIAKFFRNDSQAESEDRYLQLDEPCELQHEEHDTISLPAGNYVVRQQREYTPAGIRNVAD